MKSFRNWTRQDIADAFGLNVKTNCADLDNWLQTALCLQDSAFWAGKM